MKLNIKKQIIFNGGKMENDIIEIDKCEDCYKQEYIDKYDEKCPIVCKRSDNDE